MPCESGLFSVRYWPVPESYTRSIPHPGTPGSFLEDRGDRHHCGIDIYAAAGSPVFAIEDGVVREVDVFTSKEQIPYWNTTFSVLLESAGGRMMRYAELEAAAVTAGARVRTGMPLGSVGTVLNADRIDETSPHTYRALKSGGT